MDPVRLPPWLASERVPRSRAFLSPAPLREVTHQGVRGVLVRVRLTSYRSLPLSCIESMSLSIDGVPVDLGQARLLLGAQSIAVADLAGRSDVWWFILDSADLFVPRSEPLSPGEHRLEGALVTVEPYMTAGRFSFHNPAAVTVTLEGAES